MPVYVYGCTNDRSHEREEVAHGIGDNPYIVCAVCGAEMRRIPQAFRWGRSSWDVLAEMMDKKYIAWRDKRRKGIIKG